MGLKRKKGFNIVCKSMKTKLHRDGVSFDATKARFNELVAFYFRIVDENRNCLEIPVNDNGGWRFVEMVSNGDDPVYPMPQHLKKAPSQLKRSAIRKAIGAWSSWHSNYQRWANRPRKERHHKPPVQPRSFGFNPQYDSGMHKGDDGFSIMLKVLVATPKGEAWKWIKFRYDSYNVGNEWVKGSPTVVIKGHKASLNFPIEKYIPATGGIKKIMESDRTRVMGVDMDLDNHAAIVSVLEIEANRVTEVARHFIKTPRDVQLRKRDLGQIAKKMNATGIIHEGFAKSHWDKIRHREIEMGRAVSRQITELAKGYGVRLISFEHLGNFKPVRGRYSRRSNQKRAYWLKSKIYEGVKRIAYQDYAILTTRVNPRNTSRLDPWGGELARQNHIGFCGYRGSLNYQPGATWVMTPDREYIAHSGVNAARNIGLKAISRYKTNPFLILGEGKAKTGN